MKLALVLGLVAVAFASSHWDARPEIIRDRAYKSGQHYTYRFDGQVSSGLPIPGSQHAATRMQSLISLVFENDRTALLKLQKVRLASAQRDLVEPRDLQPFNLFEEAQLPEEQRDKLSLPVRFRYEHGLVSEVEFDGHDQAWSENIKRAVLNMLQINLNKKTLTDETEMSRISRDFESSEKTREQDYFTTQEMTLEGVCETAYTVVPSGEEEQFRVTKSLNFNKCSKRVDIRYNFRFGEKIPTCPSEKMEKDQESATVFKFELNGTPDRFLIREVELRSHYLFSPLVQDQPHMATFVANKLTLIKVDSSSERVQKPKSEKTSTIVYSTEWEEAMEQFRMTGDESLIKETPFPWMEKKFEVARLIAKEIQTIIPVEQEDEESRIPDWNQDSYIRLGHSFVDILRVLSKEEIKKVAQEMKSKQAKSIFHDILAIAGTKNTVEYLTEKMADKEISPIKTATILKELMDLSLPSEKIIDSVLRLCKEEVSVRNPIVKQSCHLTVGSLMNGLCGDRRDKWAVEVNFEKSGKKSVCSRHLKEKYVEVLKSMFEKAENEYERTLALKTIANAGIDLMVFPLEKIIKDSTEQKIVRVQAIEALRNLRSVMPKKIQSVLMPLFKDMREPVEVRVAAFGQIIHTQPERQVLDQITQQLEKERSRQVHSIVYSILKAITKSEIPQEQILAQNVEQSLKLARVQPRKMLDSHVFRGTFYSNDFSTGAAVNWGYLFANDSVLPKEVRASLDTVFAGEWTKYIAQIGFAQENLDQVLYKVLEKLEDNEVVVRGRRSDIKPSEALRQLMKKMGIQTRRPTTEKKANAMIFLRYKDMDYAVIPMDEQTINNILKKVIVDGKIEFGEVQKMLAKGYRFDFDYTTFVFENSRIVPTTLGLPLEIETLVPTSFTAKGELKVDIESGKISIRAKPQLAAIHSSHMEIRSPIVSTGVKVLHTAIAQIPLDAQAEIDWQKNFDIKVTVKAPETKKDLLMMDSRPLTYVRFESEPVVSQLSIEKTVYNPELPTRTINRVYGEKSLGVKFVVNGNVHRHLLEKIQDGQVSPLLAADNHLTMKMETTRDTPREYIIRMNVAAFEEEQKMQPEFENFYEKNNEEHFEVEDSEYLQEDDSERRVSFNKYAKNYKSKAIYRHRVNIKTEAVGSSVERRAEFELKSACDKTFTFCKWTVETSLSPIFEDERRQWTLSASVQTLFPEPVLSLKQLHEQNHRELNAVVEATWGSEEKSTLKMKIQGEQNKEQKQWQKHTIRKVEKNEKESVESMERLILASRLNQWKIVADYKMAKECQVRFERLVSLLKSWQPLTTTIEPRLVSDVYQKEGRVLAKMTVEPQTWRYVNFTMETPAETVTVENLRLPFRPTWISIEKTQSVKQLRDISRRVASGAVCQVSSKRVNTFDEVIYRAPLTTCYSVLAKDCSESPDFAVLIKNVEKNSEEKKMKIVTQENVHEIEMKRDELIVKVNGKEVQEEELEEYNLEKRGEIVIFENSDIFVRFDGYKAEIKLNELYKNKQCGLCGHYDGEEEGEFRRADNEETDDVEEFHRSFLSRDDECDMEEDKLSKKTNYKKFEKVYKKISHNNEDEDSNEWEDSIFEWNNERKNQKEWEQNETVEPEQKTLVVEQSNRICFSKQPVSECPRKTRESEETEKMKVQFACLDRSSYEGRRLLRESRREVLDIEHLKTSYSEEIVIPKTCVVY